LLFLTALRQRTSTPSSFPRVKGWKEKFIAEKKGPPIDCATTRCFTMQSAIVIGMGEKFFFDDSSFAWKLKTFFRLPHLGSSACRKANEMCVGVGGKAQKRQNANDERKLISTSELFLLPLDIALPDDLHRMMAPSTECSLISHRLPRPLVRRDNMIVVVQTAMNSQLLSGVGEDKKLRRRVSEWKLRANLDE
jgi:hypothetical protein